MASSQEIILVTGVTQHKSHRRIEECVAKGEAITADTSAAGIIKLADDARKKTHSGKFFDAVSATKLPW
ncbi:hypothetical protein LQW54_010585 [Pestalotiopsis sp. IQ-011]